MRKQATYLFVENNSISSYIDKEICKDFELIKKPEVVEGGLQAVKFLESWCSKPQDQKESHSLVVFLEAHISELSAPEILNVVQKKKVASKKGLHFFIMSSHIDKRVRSEFNDFDIIGYIEKPLTPEKLESALQKLN